MIRSDLLERNLESLEEEIAQALSGVGRRRDELRVVVVTKTHSADILEELIELGVRDLGESYVQEALEKRTELKSLETHFPGIRWHMIGHIQSRKAAVVAENFDWVHSVDSLKLANRLSAAGQALERRVRVLLQVNVSGEESKFGFPAQSQSEWDQLLEPMQTINNLNYLDLVGLMSIPPFDQDESVAREMYKKTRELRDFLVSNLPGLSLNELSMGMSNDFSSAIAEGSTMVRIGTRILGNRVIKKE